MQRVGVDKEDEVAAEPGSRLGVDHLRTLAASSSIAAATSATPMPTWCMPGPRLARKRPTCVSAPSGATNSIRPDPQAHVDRFHALLLEPAAQLDLGAEQRPIRLYPGIEVLDGKRDVVHRGTSTPRS